MPPILVLRYYCFGATNYGVRMRKTDYELLVCDVVEFRRHIKTFRKNPRRPHSRYTRVYSTLKTEAAASSESSVFMLLSTLKMEVGGFSERLIAKLYIPEEHNLNIDRCENLKPK